VSVRNFTLPKIDPCRYFLNRFSSKTVRSIDEDSWMILVVDKYDARDQLWRVSEQHNINFYDVPMQYPALEVHHDLQSGRYIAMGLRNDEPRVYDITQPRPARFTPAGLRNIGTR